jgi:uncharacterized protein YcfL
MKKLFIAIPILLLAAACSKQPSQVQQAQNQPVSISQVQPQTQQPQATTTDETANWQTYSNSQLGFSIQYPVSWVYDDTAGHIESSNSSDIADIDFRTEAGGQWQVQVSVATSTGNLQSILSSYHPNLSIDKGVSATAASKMIMLDNQPALQFSYQAPKGYTYYGDTQTFIIHNNNLYIITEGSGSSPQELQMLESFKFAN